MKTKPLLLAALILAAALPPFLPAQEQRSTTEPIPNRLIDFPGFLELTAEVAPYREKRRLTEKEFLRRAAKPGTIILDTRSAAAYAQRHLAGAVHLNFSDFTAEKLAEVIPGKTTEILIYCNNNFAGSPLAFSTKSFPAALNIPTFIHLYTYGYKNVYELGPVIDLDSTALELEGSLEDGRD